MTKEYINQMSDEFSSKYLFEHKETAREAYSAALNIANGIIEQLECSFEACNNERKEYRDKMDFANHLVLTLRSENFELREALEREKQYLIKVYNEMKAENEGLKRKEL